MFLFLLITLGLSQLNVEKNCIQWDSQTQQCGYCSFGYGLNESNLCELCKPGTYSPGGKNCLSCKNYNNCENDENTHCRYYSDEEGSARCNYCPIGKFVDFDHSNCFTCLFHFLQLY